MVLVPLVLCPAVVVIGAMTLLSVLFLAGTVFKFLIAMLGAKFDVVERVTAAEVASLRDIDLPRYTVLAPVFQIVIA